MSSYKNVDSYFHISISSVCLCKLFRSKKLDTSFQFQISMSHWLSDQGGEQNLVLVNNNVNTPAITGTLSLSAPELSLPSARSSKMSTAWWDDLYCAKLLRFSDKLRRRERRILSASGGEYLCLTSIIEISAGVWQCVACARVRSWHFIIWISAQLDTINYPDLCQAVSCDHSPPAEIYDNQPLGNS